MDKLQMNIEQVKQRIEQAAQKSGRSGSEVTLVAVSKTVDVDTARQAYHLGLENMGENRVQELKIKTSGLPEARWHMIGRLQTNKVKDVVGRVVLIHSLDRWKLAEELNKRGEYLSLEVPALLQVNIAGEKQKAGIPPDEIKAFLQSVSSLKALKILGLMTMAPLGETAEKSRPIFKELAALKKEFSRENYPQVDLKYLSMGMSQDFEVAVEEGANIVRIGSAIFQE